MQVVVDSLLTSYTVQGAGTGRPTILIIHGWGDSSAGWQSFGRRLADDYIIYCVDLPGFGSTDKPSEAWGLDDYAKFVVEFLKKLHVQPYAIIGHSNGGAIAIRGLSDGQLQADRLVLLASAGVRSEYKGRKKILRLVAKAGKALATPLPGSVKERLRRKMYTTVGSDMLVAEHLQSTFKRIVDDDVQADASTLLVTTLLVYGEADVATPPVYGRLLHEKISGSTLKIIGDAEHFVHNDQPDKVVAIVKDFLK